MVQSANMAFGLCPMLTQGAIEALAATLGHTQSLHTNSLDEAIALPTDGPVESLVLHTRRLDLAAPRIL